MDLTLTKLLVDCRCKKSLPFFHTSRTLAVQGFPTELLQPLLHIHRCRTVSWYLQRQAVISAIFYAKGEELADAVALFFAVAL